MGPVLVWSHFSIDQQHMIIVRKNLNRPEDPIILLNPLLNLEILFLFFLHKRTNLSLAQPFHLDIGLLVIQSIIRRMRHDEKIDQPAVRVRWDRNEVVAEYDECFLLVGQRQG